MAGYLQVTAPVVVVRDPSGAQHYFYDGAILPAGLDGDHVKQLLDQGMVGEVVGDVIEPEVEPEVEAPAKSASKGDWEAFARAQGATDADLDGLTKDDLIAAYGD